MLKKTIDQNQDVSKAVLAGEDDLRFVLMIKKNVFKLIK